MVLKITCSKMIFYTIVCLILQLCIVRCRRFTTYYTIRGLCPDMKLQEDLDYTRFSGHWYNTASYSSDNRTENDCTTMEFQEDNLGFTLKETYVKPDDEKGNKTQNTYFARVDPTFDAGNRAKFIISYESGDNVLQYPFVILTTDYDTYAITYTCHSVESSSIQMHYVFFWVLTRSKEKLEGQNFEKIENALLKYPEMAARRNHLFFKDFNESTCAFNIKEDVNTQPRNFW